MNRQEGAERRYMGTGERMEVDLKAKDHLLAEDEVIKRQSDEDNGH